MITEQSIKDGLKRAKFADQKVRQERARMYLDYYNNDQLKHTGKRLIQMFPLTNSDLYPYLRNYPVTEQITNDSAIMFNVAPKLTVNPAQKLEPESDIVKTFQTEIIDKPMLMPTLIQINRYTNLLYKIGVMPRWYAKGGQVEYTILTPDKVMVFQDEDSPSHITAVLYPVDPLTDTFAVTKPLNRYMMMTDEEICEIEIISADNVKIISSEPNKYKRIPVAWFQNAIPIDGFWIDKRNPIVEANEVYNVNKALEKLMIVLQSYSTLVTINLPQEKLLKWGVNAVLNLQSDESPNGTADAKYITPDPKIEMVNKIIEDEINQMAGYAGLSKEAYRNETNQFTSGYHLELSKQEVINNAELEKPFYTAGITDLVMIACSVYSVHSKKTLQAVNDIGIDYQQIQFKKNPIEVWQARVFEKQYNAKSEIDFIQEDNPDLGRKEAEDLHARVKADNSTFTADTAKMDKDLGIAEK